MSRYQKDQLLILRKTPYADEHFIVSAYGYRLGEISFKIPFSRKLSSYKPALLNEFNLIEAKLYLGSKYYSLSESQILHIAHPQLDLPSLCFKNLISDFLSKNCKDPQNSIWQLLHYIAHQKQYRSKQVLIFFSKFLEIQGLLCDHPQLPKTLRFYLTQATFSECERLKLDALDSQKSWDILKSILFQQLNYQIPAKLQEVMQSSFKPFIQLT